MDASDTLFDIPTSLPRIKGLSMTCRPMELNPCFKKDKAEPHLIIATTDVPNSQAESRAGSSDMLWVCSRAMLQNAKQKVLTWAGWVSSTESSKDESSQESIVDYMAPVFSPINENITV